MIGELFLAGVNHRAAPLEVRERLAIAPDRIPSILNVFAGRESLPGMEPFLAGGDEYVLHPVTVEMAMTARPKRPLLIADLAVPRDVDPRVAESSNVSLVNIDDLDRLVHRRHPLAAAARQAAEDIITDETQAFLAWWESRANAPLICALQAKAGAILREQVEQTSRRLGDLTPQQRCALEAMGQAMISKLLHDPIEFLHSSSRSSPSSVQPEVEELFKKVFGLS